MDFATLNSQLNEQFNRWYVITRDYFSQLSQNELYGWIGETVGLVLLILGLILL